jgi:hypothetical protein
MEIEEYFSKWGDYHTSGQTYIEEIMAEISKDEQSLVRFFSLFFLMTLECISCAVAGAGGVENDHLVLEGPSSFQTCTTSHYADVPDVRNGKVTLQRYFSSCCFIGLKT